MRYMRMETAEASGRNRTVTIHGLLRQENGREGLPHLMSRQLPTKHAHTQNSAKIYIAHNPGHSNVDGLGLFWVIDNFQAWG